MIISESWLMKPPAANHTGFRSEVQTLHREAVVVKARASLAAAEKRQTPDQESKKMPERGRRDPLRLEMEECAISLRLRRR
jgi:hypothetical protein